MSWLSALTLTPLFAGAAVLLGRLDKHARVVCSLVSLLLLGISLYVFFTANAGSTGLQFREFRTLFGSAAIGWNLAVDGWGLSFQLLAALVVASAALTADDEIEGGSAWILTIGGAAMGVILSFNLLLTMLFLALFIFCITFAALEALGNAGRQAISAWLGSAATGWLLLLATTILLGVDTSNTSNTNVISFNHPSLLRLNLEAEPASLRLILFTTALAALAGLWPFGGGHASLARHLPSSLAQVTFLLPPLIAVLLLARYGLPIFAGAVLPLAPWLYGGALVVASFAAIQCLTKTSLQVQLQHTITAFVGTTLAAMFVLSAGATTGALLLLANATLALALVWHLLGWLNKNGLSDPDAWTLSQAVTDHPWLLVLTLLGLWSWAALPASAGFSAQVLMLFSTLDLALASYNKGGSLNLIYAALALALPVLLISCYVGVHVFALPGQSAQSSNLSLVVSLRQRWALALLALAILTLSLQPTYLLSRSNAAIKFIYERRLLGSDPQRAPSYEAPLEP